MGVRYETERRVPLDTTIWGDVPRGLLENTVNTDAELVAAAAVVKANAPDLLDMLGLTERLAR